MISLPSINLSTLFGALVGHVSGAQDSIAQAAISTVVESYANEIPSVLEAALTVPTAECQALAARLGISGDANVAAFTTAVQAIGREAGQVAAIVAASKEIDGVKL